MQLMPFIILGIGVDDIFVMVRSMEEVTAQDRTASIPQRFRRALNVGGMSITVTSATNFAAFMFGSLTSIPAVKWCVVAVTQCTVCTTRLSAALNGILIRPSSILRSVQLRRIRIQSTVLELVLSPIVYSLTTATPFVV